VTAAIVIPYQLTTNPVVSLGGVNAGNYAFLTSGPSVVTNDPEYPGITVYRFWITFNQT